MLYGDKLREIESRLTHKGLSTEVRNAIRNEKICIIDDQITDLKSMIDGLKREGFTNLIEMSKSPPINELLNAQYDLIILDLNNVAIDLSKDDGIGILNHIKTHDPFQPVLVVTGQNTPADKNTILNKANLIRQKPVKPSDFATDIEEILRIKKDRLWASIAILKELNSIQTETKNELSLWLKIKLAWRRRQLEKKLIDQDPDILTQIYSISQIVGSIDSITSSIIYITKFFHK